MNKKMYELNYHYAKTNPNRFSHCTVTPITVIRELEMSGGLGIFINYINVEGKEYSAAKRDYYDSEVEAWAAARSKLIKTVSFCEKQILNLSQEANAIRRFLSKI